MTGKTRRQAGDRLKDRSDIGRVEFPIERLMEFREAGATCVYIESALENDCGLGNRALTRPKRPRGHSSHK
jgi:hypothetical protein